MNETPFDQKFRQDAYRVKNDLNTLKEDGINKLSKVSEDLDHSADDMAAWFNTGVAHLSSKFEKVKDDATKTVSDTTSTVMKSVGDGLSQYNAKAAEVAKKLPGGIGVKAVEYPWVAMSFTLLAGFLLRGVLMPRRNYRA